MIGLFENASSILTKILRHSCLAGIFVFALGTPLYASIKIGLLFVMLFITVVPLIPHSRFVDSYAVNIIKIFLALSIVSTMWVFFFSTEKVLFHIAVISIGGICLFILRGAPLLSESPTPWKIPHLKTSSIPELFLIVNFALILRGWTHLIFITVPLLIYLVVITKILTRFKGMCFRLLSQGVVGLAVVVGAWASHVSLQPMSSRFWVTYDQVFRSAMATGLTRWGWTDSNFGTGYAFTYHWLPEAVGGVLSRVSGVEEVDVITRIMPAFGMLFASAVLTEILRRFLVNKLTILLIALIVLTVEGSFELFSIGTIWGASVFLLAVWLFVELATDIRLQSRILLLVILPMLSLLSQSALGLSLVLGFASTLVFLFFSGAHPKLLTLVNLLFLGLSTLLLQQTLFRKASVLSSSGMFNLEGFLNFPALSTPLGRSPESTTLHIHANSLFYLFLLVATYLIGFWFRPDSIKSKIWQFLIGSLFAASVLLLNFFSLGTYSGKFLAPIGLLGFLTGLITLGRLSEVISFNHLLKALIAIILVNWFARRVVDQFSTFDSYIQNVAAVLMVTVLSTASLFALLIGRAKLTQGSHDSMTKPLIALLFIGSFLFFWPRQHVPQSIRGAVFSNSRDHSFFLEDRNVRNCLDFIRINTRSDTVIATNMWRLPGLSDERYVLTSLITERRTLVDGPVFDHVNWPSREYFEDLKNIHTSFANSMDQTSHRRLLALGATYFVLDTRVFNPDQDWSKIGEQLVKFKNSQCTIIKL